MNTTVARSYNPAIQFVQLVSMHLRMYRAQVPFIMMVQCVLSLGLVFGFGYLVPNITRTTALFLVTGTATQALVTVGLVMLPKFLS
jgi:ABC-2 type transport system permease protein